jgi:DNA-binding transcriptional ArsR family regulator
MKHNLILHPVRLRILITLAGREMTVQQLTSVLSDIPQATLYRHVSLLVKEHMLSVVKEQQIRGQIEKTYGINAEAAPPKVTNLAGASADDHMRYFMMFVNSLLADFVRYRSQGEVEGKLDVVGDGVIYTTIPLNLSDEEFKQLGAAVQTVMLPFLNNSLTAERQRRLFTTIVIPDGMGE